MKPVITKNISVDPTHDEVPPAALGRKLRRADDFIKIAVTACDGLLHGDNTDIDATETGLFLGTAFGPMETNFEVLDLILEEGRSSPFLFSHSVFNAAAGYIAEIYNIKGCGQTITDFSWPFLLSLREGCSAINAGRLQRCLILQVETYSPLLEDSRQDLNPHSPAWPMGGVAWLLERSDRVSKGYQVDSLDINSRPAAPEAYLSRVAENRLNDIQLLANDPLSSARELTRYIEKNEPQKLEFCSNADYGTAKLLLHKTL
ncbi:MAG: beta-ketoacyl synthase chain length factor [Desulfobulbaceae bacterium]|nr:beta-ketoacyl synthase chain length factor [Desulfobulbaceae bacterium]